MFSKTIFHLQENTHVHRLELLDFLRCNPQMLDRIVLETDDPVSGDIKAHYNIIAEKLALDPTGLQKKMYAQFERIYYAGNF